MRWLVLVILLAAGCRTVPCDLARAAESQFKLTLTLYTAYVENDPKLDAEAKASFIWAAKEHGRMLEDIRQCACGKGEN